MRVSALVTNLVADARQGFLRGGNLELAAVTRVLDRLDPTDHMSMHALVRLVEENLEKVSGSSQANRFSEFVELLEALREQVNQRRLQALELSQASA